MTTNKQIKEMLSRANPILVEGLTAVKLRKLAAVCVNLESSFYPTMSSLSTEDFQILEMANKLVPSENFDREMKAFMNSPGAKSCPHESMTHTVNHLNLGIQTMCRDCGAMIDS